MKKVLFVASVVKTHIMVFHIPYLKYFKENGFETYVCAKNDYENKSDCNIPYCDNFIDIPFERNPFKPKNILAFKKLKKVIKKYSFDIIHCHTPIGGALTRLVSIRNKHAKVIYTAHGFHFYKGAPLKNWVLFYPIEKLLSKYTDILITINKEDYNLAKKIFKAKKTFYVPGVGIDINKFNQQIISKEQLREKIGIPRDAFVITSVGELNKNKNHEVIIKALSQLKREEFYYLICGDGPLKDYLNRLIKEMNLKDNVKLLGYCSNVNEILKVSDLFVFPSHREGLPVSLMEAMASNLPIVCSNIRGNIDLIEHNKNGYLVNPNDIEGFKLAIERLYNNPEIIYKFKKENSEKIKKFSKEQVYEYMSEIYQFK